MKENFELWGIYLILLSFLEAYIDSHDLKQKWYYRLSFYLGFILLIISKTV